MTVPASWKMIDALMYGINPRPKIVDWLMLPPEKIDMYVASRPATPASPACCFWASSTNIFWSTPGSGTLKPMR